MGDFRLGFQPIGRSSLSDPKSSLFNFNFGRKRASSSIANRDRKSKSNQTEKINGNKSRNSGHGSTKATSSLSSSSSRNLSTKSQPKGEKQTYQKKISNQKSPRNGNDKHEPRRNERIRSVSSSSEETDVIMDNEQSVPTLIEKPASTSRQIKRRANGESKSPSRRDKISRFVRNSKHQKLSSTDADASPGRKMIIYSADSEPESTAADADDRITSPLRDSTMQNAPASSSTPSNDEDGSSEEERDENALDAEFVIEEKSEQYNQLQNSDLTKNMMIVPQELIHNVAGFMKPDFSTAEQQHPGILRTITSSVSNTIDIGYVKIDGKTVKPPDCCGDGRTIYWVLEGIITVKSAGGWYNLSHSISSKNYLYGKELGPGVSIVIPRNTMYTLENWSNRPVLLSYCLIQEEDEDINRNE